MILSLPLATVLNLFLSQSQTSEAFVPAQKIASSTFHSKASSLYARPNRNIPTSDPYASLINKIEPSASSPSSDATATATAATTTADTSSIISDPSVVEATTKSVVEQVNDLVDQVNQAANTALEASNSVTEIASVSAPGLYSATSLTTDAVTKAAVDSTTSASSSSSSSSYASSYSSPFSSSSATDDSFEKVPTLFEFIKSGSITDYKTNVPSSTKENLALLKNNLITPVEKTVLPSASKAISESTNIAKGVVDTTSQGLNEVTQSAKSLVFGMGAASATATSTATATDGGSVSSNFDSAGFDQLVQNLQLDTYGPWIAGGATLMYAFSAKDSGRKEAMAKYEAELKIAQEKAVEAADAAKVAAQGAQMAKQLVEKMDVKGGENIGDIMLETSRLELVKVENKLMKQKINMLTEENLEQRVIIAQLREKLNPKKVVVEETGKTNSDVVVVKEIMNRDPKEDAKFLELIKSIDDLNAKQKETTTKKAEKKAKKKKAKNPQVAAVEVVEEAKHDDVEVETKTSQKKKKIVKKKKKSAKSTKEEDTLETLMSDDISEEQPEEKSTIKGLDDTEATFFMDALAEFAEEELSDVDPKTQDLLMRDLGNVQKEIEDILGKEQSEFESKLEDAKPKKKVKKKVKKKKTVKKQLPKAEVRTEVADVVDVDSEKNPWGVLKQSTLQRKTIAQLTEYLTEREVDVSGLSKKDMVVTVQNL